MTIAIDFVCDCVTKSQTDPFGILMPFLKKENAEENEFMQKWKPDCYRGCRLVNRQALAGLLWSKQFYYYVENG